MFYRRGIYRRSYRRPYRGGLYQPFGPMYRPYRPIGFRPLRAFGCLFTLGMMSIMFWLLLVIIF